MRNIPQNGFPASCSSNRACLRASLGHPDQTLLNAGLVRSGCSGLIQSNLDHLEGWGWISIMNVSAIVWLTNGVKSMPLQAFPIRTTCSRKIYLLSLVTANSSHLKSKTTSISHQVEKDGDSITTVIVIGAFTADTLP